MAYWKVAKGVINSVASKEQTKTCFGHTPEPAKKRVFVKIRATDKKPLDLDIGSQLRLREIDARKISWQLSFEHGLDNPKI